MRFLFLIGISLFTGDLLANTNQCQPKNIFEFYNKLNQNNPIQEQIQKRMKEIDTNINIAKQRPNPVFDFEYLKGNQFGVDTNNVSASIQHVFEYGSKRARRIEEAELATEIQKKQLALEGLDSNVSYVLKYQRLAQLDALIEAVKEAIETFDDVIRRLNSRNALNPEERVSLSTLRLAASDYRAKLNDLENEQTLLKGDLFFFTGCENIRPSYMQLNYKSIISPLKEIASNENGLINLQLLRVRHAEAELAVQKSLGYSDIAIGPAFEYETEGRDKFISGGVAITFDIPLFHTNNAGKKNALRKLVAQKVESKNTINNLSIKQNRLIEKYLRSIKVLTEMPSLKTLHKQHQEVERLFSRGIVSIPMTIESHRQHIDFLESRFETENDLLVSLEEIVFIKGSTELLEKLFSVANVNSNNKDKK